MFKGAAEVLGCQLVTIHNIAYMLRLTRGMRKAIMEGRYANFVCEFLHGQFPDGGIPVWVCDALDAAECDWRAEIGTFEWGKGGEGAAEGAAESGTGRWVPRRVEIESDKDPTILKDPAQCHPCTKIGGRGGAGGGGGEGTESEEGGSEPKKARVE